MNIEQLVDKVKEIKELILETVGLDTDSDNNLTTVIKICEQIEIDYKVSQRLGNN